MLQSSQGGAQMNIFMFKTRDFDIWEMERRIANHPFVHNSERQQDKEAGGHLSPFNIGFRTCRNFSVLSGYTDNGDGAPRRNGLQMTHVWMRMTRGNKGPDGGAANLRQLANMMCEIAGFDLPYPESFGQKRLAQLTAVGVASEIRGSAAAVGGRSTGTRAAKAASQAGFPGGPRPAVGGWPRPAVGGH